MQVELNIAYNTFVADLTGAELEVFTRIVNKLQMVNSLTTYEGLGPVYPLSGSKIDWRIGVNTIPATIISEAEAKEAGEKTAMVHRAGLVAKLLADPVDAKRQQGLIDQLWYDSIWTREMKEAAIFVDHGLNFIALKTGGVEWHVGADGSVTKP